MTRCKGQGCVHWARPGPLCERCQWLQAIGLLVDLVFWHGATTGVPEGGPMPVAFIERLQILRLTRPLDRFQEDALDAVAFLLIERATTRRRHQKELRDEIQDGSRAARDAFSSGLLEGLDQRNRG